MAIVRILDSDASCFISLDLEEYLKGVLPREMSTGWPLEALKAQAVAARSYALKIMARGVLFRSEADQVYGEERFADTDAAVEATRGEVLTVGGHVIAAFFFSHCNGRTNDRHMAGWGPIQDESCFQSVACECGFTEHNAHGIGMCQWGARRMAERGAGYREILLHYYSGVVVAGDS